MDGKNDAASWSDKRLANFRCRSRRMPLRTARRAADASGKIFVHVSMVLLPVSVMAHPIELVPRSSPHILPIQE